MDKISYLCERCSRRDDGDIECALCDRGNMFIERKRYSNYYDYARRDIESTRKIATTLQFTIKNVIFNAPATIVMWGDGTKTVVKCQDGDVYDAEKGLAMAISKKALGNKGNFNEVFKKWLPEEDVVDMMYPDIPVPLTLKFDGKTFVEAIRNLGRKNPLDVEGEEDK